MVGARRRVLQCLPIPLFLSAYLDHRACRHRDQILNRNLGWFGEDNDVSYRHNTAGIHLYLTGTCPWADTLRIAWQAFRVAGPPVVEW